MFRVFFTGAFRKPREINWVIGTLLSMLAIVEGFTGYSLPDDLLSGTGLRATEGFMRSIPVIGSYVSYFVFGGAFPGEAIIPRLFTVHVLLLPAILVGLFTAHILLVFVHKHTQYPGPGRTNDNVVGYPLMPVYAAKAGGFFFIVFGVIAAHRGAGQPSTRSGCTAPTTPPRSPPARSPTGTWASPTAPCVWSPGSWSSPPSGFTFSMNVFIPAILLIPVLYGLARLLPVPRGLGHR